MIRIGVISDTHGLLRPEALAFLEGCDRIIHAGDIGSALVLDRLRHIAPVTAVRGNNDRGDWAETLPESELFQVGAHYCYLIHDLKEMGLDPHAAGVSMVISGHTHQPKLERRSGCLYLNPGAAGPRRFKLPVSIAEVFAGDTVLDAKLVTLA